MDKLNINEKRSYTEYTVTEPTTDFQFGFTFTEGVDVVHMLVNNVAASEQGYTVRLKNSFTLEVQPPVVSGTVRVYRETDIDDTLYNYTAGALFEAATMDANFEQILHSQQEVSDGFNKLSDDTYAIINTLETVSEDAQAAADAAKEAANTANEAAAQVSDKLSKSEIRKGSLDWKVLDTPYDVGYRVALANGDIVKSTINANPANPNDSMLGWVSVGNTITVSTVNDMLNILNPKNGDVVYAKGFRLPTLFVETNPFKGGGMFIYDSAKVNLNDGGVILNGWVRQIVDRVSPCMFGAYANDYTNDVPFIQQSINFAIKTKVLLDFEGRYYCVKKESYTSDVLQHFLSINGSIEIVGNGANIRVDQSTAPVASKIMTLFRPFRKTEDATNYSKSIGRIHIHGFDFDGGFNYDNETDFTTIQDVKKCFFFYDFEVIYDELKINSNRFRRFAQQNVITVGFSPSFKTYGISKKTTISDNLFYDNGLDADMSTLYIMSKEITIDGANKFEQPKGREKHCMCAMELHGTGAVVTGNFFTNTTAWVNFAVNQIEETVGQFVFSNNVGEALQAVGNIWSGESMDEALLSEIICTNNTVRFIDSPDFDFRNRNRNVLGTGGFNKSLQSLIVSNNTCKVDSLTDDTPVYFLDIAVQYDWISDLFNLSVLGNTGYDMTGFAVIGRYITQNIDNCFIRNVTIGSNSIFNTADVFIKAITINQIIDPTASVSNLNVFGNTISSNYNKVAWFIKGTGNIGNVDIGLNTYNNKPVSTDAIIFDIKPNRISTTQSRNHVEYGDINPTKNPHIESVKREYLQLRVNLSELSIVGTNGYLPAGVFYTGVRIKAVRIKMSVGVSKLVDGDILNASVYASSVISDSVSVIERITPSVSFKLNAESEFPLAANEFFSLLFSTNKAEYLNTLKASGGNVFFEFELEKLV